MDTTTSRIARLVAALENNRMCACSTSGADITIGGIEFSFADFAHDDPARQALHEGIVSEIFKPSDEGGDEDITVYVDFPLYARARKIVDRYRRGDIAEDEAIAALDRIDDIEDTTRPYVARVCVDGDDVA